MQVDKVFTMNNEEKNEDFKLDLVEFNTEMEVLSSRREYYRNNLETFAMK